MAAKNTKSTKGGKVVNLTAAQKKVQTQVVQQLSGAMDLVENAAGADGLCIMALHAAYVAGIPCSAVVHLALDGLKKDAVASSTWSRKTRLYTVAEGVDKGVKIPHGKDRTLTTIGSLLKVKDRAGSLQGLYSKILAAGKPEASAQDRLDVLNAKIIAQLKNDEALLDFFEEEKNFDYLIAEARTQLDVVKKAAAAKVAKK